MSATIPTYENTASVEEVCEGLAEHGVIVINDYAGEETMRKLWEDLGPQVDETPFSADGFSGSHTKRISSLFARSYACGDLVTQRHLIGAAKYFIQHPKEIWCGDRMTVTPTLQVGFAQLIQIWPGQQRQVLHRDDQVHLQVHPKPHQTRMQFMLAMDDFTAEKGATLVIPGSHLWDDDREPTYDEVVPAVMKTGAAAIFLGSTYHAGGENVADVARTGLSMAVDAGNVRQEENQYLAISREIVREYPEQVRDLLGWKVCPPFLGWYEMNEPSVLLDNPDQDKIAARSDLF